MSRQVSLDDAKARLPQLLEDVARGEEIVITKDGEPLATLKAVPAPEKPPEGKRVLGQLKGQVWLTPDFDEADAEIERLFYEGDLNDPASEFKHK
jgi:antitoxin (DNA-binding transcriptional repressor) of toxin-antitoxin stability system